METKKLKIFNVLSIINLVLTLAFCGIYFSMYDKQLISFWLINAFVTAISNLINYFYLKWVIKTENSLEDKKNDLKVYILFIVINLIPIVNMILLVAQVIMAFCDYVDYLTKHDKIDYNI